MKLFISLLTLSLIASSAILEMDRGEWGSGGGNGIVCFQKVSVNDDLSLIVKEIENNENIIPDKYLGNIKSIELFDLFEAKKRRGFNSKLPEIVEIQTSEKYSDYFERLMKRFEDHSQQAPLILGQAFTIVPESNFIFSDTAIRFQNDIGEVTLPSNNCLLTTIAAQVNYNNFYQVHIDNRLFDHPNHSKQSRATLILHEYIYAYGRAMRGHKESAQTRELVRFFISRHESVNERSLSFALYDLDFLRQSGPGDYTNLTTRYTSSAVGSLFVNHIIDSIQYLKMVQTVFESGEVVKFIEKISEIYKNEGLPQLDEFYSNAELIVKTFEMAEKFSQDQAKWKKIDKELTRLLEYDVINLRDWTEVYAKELTRMLTDYTKLELPEARRLSVFYSDTLKRHLSFFTTRHLIKSLIDLDKMNVLVEITHSSMMAFESGYCYVNSDGTQGCIEPVDLSIPIK